MNRKLLAVVLALSMTAVLGCNDHSDRSSLNQPDQQSTSALKVISANTTVPDPVQTAQQQRCEALDDRWEELEGMQMEHRDKNRDRRIEKRGFTDSATDADYNALKQCHRNRDENLRLEKPALECCRDGVSGLKFGMSEAEIEAPTHFVGKWTVACKPMTNVGTKIASMCNYLNADEVTARISRQSGLGDRVPYVIAFFDSDGRLILFTRGDWVPASAYENTSNVIRFWRNEDLSYLDIPDQQSENSAAWYFKSKSAIDKQGMHKTLESVSLITARQGNSFSVTVTYTDDENYRQE
ncbi:MAG: hypothetical protein WA254_08635 [Candidatus Sulfotelmatobacter sp.]